MKNKLTAIATLVLIAAILLMCFAACGNESNSGTATSDSAASASAGTIEEGVTYQLVGIVQNGKDDSETIALLEKSGMNTTLVRNGTKVTMLDDVYTLEDGKIFNDDNSFTYSAEDDMLTLDDGKGGVTKFKKR